MRAKLQQSGATRSASIFAALGDETRLRLVARLCADAPVSISGLTAGSEISRQAITKHLHVLAKAGLVRGTRRGRERLYEVDSRRIEEARQYLETISRQWEDALDRLKFLTESG